MISNVYGGVSSLRINLDDFCVLCVQSTAARLLPLFLSFRTINRVNSRSDRTNKTKLSITHFDNNADLTLVDDINILWKSSTKLFLHATLLFPIRHMSALFALLRFYFFACFLKHFTCIIHCRCCCSRVQWWVRRKRCARRRREEKCEEESVMGQEKGGKRERRQRVRSSCISFPDIMDEWVQMSAIAGTGVGWSNQCSPNFFIKLYTNLQKFSWIFFQQKKNSSIVKLWFSSPISALPPRPNWYYDLEPET